MRLESVRERGLIREKDGGALLMSHGESLLEHTCHCSERRKNGGEEGKKKRRKNGRGITNQDEAAPL